MKTEFLLEFIKNEWADIHHTRNQEWTSLAIIGGVFYALFSVEGSGIKAAIALIGSIACIFIIIMLHRHWKLFRKKIRFITLLEQEIGIEFKFYKDKNEENRVKRISVQSIIMFLYFLLLTALLSTFVWYGSVIIALKIFKGLFSEFVHLIICGGISIPMLVLSYYLCFHHYPEEINDEAKNVEIHFINPLTYEIIDTLPHNNEKREETKREINK